MDISIARYFKRKKIELQCETVTPLFLGNAHQEAEWRSAPFKSLLRYWWRITQHHCLDEKTLLKQESELFGYAGDSDNESKINQRKSLIHIMIYGQPKPENRLERPPNVNLKIQHPEMQGSIDSLLYLAGMGLMDPKEGVRHSFFPPGSNFLWVIDYPHEIKKELDAIFALLLAFGAIGARSRNGWGSFQVENEIMAKETALNLLNECTMPWDKGFKKDYPNCLGKDEKGPLLWKTKSMHSWAEGMRELADAYVGVRAKTIEGIPKLDPDGKNDPSERHLLGFPLNNHPARNVVGWGSSGRHASPLRFVVRRRQEGYTGFVLHLPHAHSKEMKLPDKINQLDVWQKVHNKLDKLMARASYKECL